MFGARVASNSDMRRRPCSLRSRAGRRFISAAPKMNRGRAGHQGPDGPADLDASRHRGLSKSDSAASPPFPRRPARGVLRFAPPRPRWTSRFRRPASPLELEGRLSTAVGPGRVRRACDRCRSRHHGARRRAAGAPGRGGLDRRLGDRRRISSAPNRPPPPAPRQKTLDQTPLGNEGEI
jgi:hypothetical protein